MQLPDFSMSFHEIQAECFIWLLEHDTKIPKIDLYRWYQLWKLIKWILMIQGKSQNCWIRNFFTKAAFTENLFFTNIRLILLRWDAQDCANWRKAVERKAVERKAVERKAVERKAVERKAVERKAVERKAVERKAVERKAVERKAHPAWQCWLRRRQIQPSLIIN